MFANRAFFGAAAFFCTLFSAAAPQRVDAEVSIPPSPPQITGAINPNLVAPMQTNVRPEVGEIDGVTILDNGRVDDDLPLPHLLLLLHRPDAEEQALEAFMAEQTTPGSANYHNWLSVEQVGEYGPAQSDIDTLTTWLQAQGFTINQVNGDRVSIDFSGTAATVRQAFRTEIHELDVNGELHIANMSVPTIPAALAPAVIGIASLNDFKPHTNYRALPGYTAGSGNYYLVPADLATIYNINPLLTGAPKIDGTGQTIVLLEQEDLFSTSDITTFRSTFGLPTLNTAGNPTFTIVHPGGCTDPGDSNDGTDGEVELDIEWAGASAPGANLVMASCRGVTSPSLVLAMQGLNNANDSARLWSLSYGLCESSNGGTENALYSSSYQTAAARGVSVFVSSGDEGAASCDANKTTATHGITVSGLAATPYNVAVGGTDYGDAYAGTSSTYWNSTNTATFGSAKSYINEIPWNDSCASQLLAAAGAFYNGLWSFGTTYGSGGFCNNAAYGEKYFLTTASGSGGPSNCHTGTPAGGSGNGGSCTGLAKPAWQSGFLGNAADNVRDIPDVSLFAANGIWGHYFIYCYSNPAVGPSGVVLGKTCTAGNPGAWSGAGGTSFSAPIWAGIQALVNDYTGEAQGNPNPTYYALATTEYGASGSTACNSSKGNAAGSTCIFYDVTQGDMDVNCTGSNNCYLPSGTNGVLSTSNGAYAPAYGTNTGWDFATGIGTPNVTNLVHGWPSGLAAQSVTFSTAPTNAQVGGATYAVSATASSGLTPVTLTIDASATSVCSMTGGTNSGTVSFIGTGTCKIDASQAGNSVYKSVTSSQSFGVGVNNQTITFTSTAPGSAVVGGATYNVTASSTSGLTVALTIDSTATSICSITGSTVSFTAFGTCVIDANQSGNSNYNAAPQVQQSFSVGKGAQTINFTSTAPSNAVVGGATYNVTATGGASGNSVTFTIDASSAGACSITGSTVSFVAFGTCVIDANQSGNANYNAAPQTQQSFAVGKGAQAINFTSTAPSNAVVGGATYNVTATGGASGNAVTFSIDASSASVCSITGSTVSFTAFGTCVIDANQTGNSNYNAAPQAQQSFSVGKGAQAISFTSTAPSSAVVGGATYNVTATGGASGNSVTFTIDASSAGACSIAGSTVSFTAFGTCVIDANQTGNANYNAAPQVQQSFAVGKGAQAINFTSTAPSNAVVGGATYNVTATGGASGSSVTFTIDASSAGACSITGSTVSFTAFGTCVIDANQTGNANYNAAPQVQQSFAVGKGAQAIHFTSTAPSNAVVGGATYNVTASGGASGNSVNITIDGTSAGVCTISGSTVSFVAAGTCLIDANQAGNANYNAAPQSQQSFVVGKGSQAINFTSTIPSNAVVGGATYNVTATGGASGNVVSITIDGTSGGVCTISGSTVSFVGAGTCLIDANQAGNANYNAAPQAQQSFLVGKADQAITFTSTVPSSAIVGGATYNVTATGGASGNAVNITIDSTSALVCTISGSTVSFIGSGTCLIDANQAGNANYNAAPQMQQSFFVGKGDQAITFTSTAPSSATVGGATYNVTATGGASGNTVNITIDETSASVCTINGSIVSFTGVGTCLIDANQAGNANYNAAPQAQQSFGVSAAPASVLVFTSEPSSLLAGDTTAATVSVEDGSGNVATSDNTTKITVSASTCGGEVLQTVTVVGGVATFPELRFYTVATNQTLHATSVPAATSTDSSAFDVSTNTDKVFWDGFESCRP